MKRIYEDYAYSNAPVAACYWSETTTPHHWDRLSGTQDTDVAIIGAGFTGLNTALTLAKAGLRVTVLDAHTPGWGASGRNGGFCCQGGSLLDSKSLTRHFGAQACKTWHETEIAAINHVAGLLDTYQIEADTHSDGETVLAHSAKAWNTLQHYGADMARDDIAPPELIPAAALRDHGLTGPFHGALRTPFGFALNPRKYVDGLSKAAAQAGARIHANSPVTQIAQARSGYSLKTPQGTLTARQIVIATNGYTSEDLPRWMAARYLPVQSSIFVTRPITQAELTAAGWTSLQMCYDTRNLLHYFRRMPDGRFLFGMRGGIFATARATRRIAARARADFDAMFPALAHVETEFAWSGLACLTGSGAPYVGPVPEMPGAFAAFGYHGNGVAMGSYCGHMLARLILGEDTRATVLTQVPRRFPLRSKRRWLLPPAYAWMSVLDR